MRTVFLVEKDTSSKDSLVMDTHINLSNKSSNFDGSNIDRSVEIPRPVVPSALPTPTPSPDGRIYPEKTAGGVVKAYVEVWDYVGSARFRGFVAEKEENERSMFIFFDQEVVGKDLKPG